MIVSAEWLASHLNDPSLRLVDVRSLLGDPDKGRSEYAIGHIPGAQFLDVESDLAGHEGGGRHPLPDLDTFASTIGSLGISRDHQVVIYDADHGSMAARLWWMLRHIGHERAAVLDGGWPAWIQAGGSQTSVRPGFTPVTYEMNVRTDDQATRTEVAKRSSTTTLIDARAGARYRGEFEPIDPVAGHIRGAINIPHESLARDGRMLPVAELTLHLTADRDAIAYCGSGVTACYVILAHAVAGFPLPKLYVGSWSDWVGAGMPVAVTGTQTAHDELPGTDDRISATDHRESGTDGGESATDHPAPR